MAMNSIYNVFTHLGNLYKEINPATLNGAIDVVMVQQPDGKIVSGPFHVRFGKIGVLRAKEKVVDIEINGRFVEDVHMKLGEAGEAFFVEATESNDVPEYLATSPIPNSLQFMEEGLEQLKLSLSENINDLDKATQTDLTAGHVELLSPNNPDAPLDINFEKNYEQLRNTPPKDGCHLSSSTQTFENEILPLKVSNDWKRMKAKRAKRYVSNSDDVFKLDHVSGELSMSYSLPHLDSEKWSAVDPEIHPFSDGDITPQMSPEPSRSPSPKSDTEFEVRQIRAETGAQTNLTGDKFQVINELFWEWGELPKSTSTTPVAIDKSDVNKQPNWNFTKNGKQIKEEGIYLSDLEADEEVASHYLYSTTNVSSRSPALNTKDDDVESGHGRSLPQSPVEQVIKPVVRRPEIFPTVSLSLCGNASEASKEKFAEHLVTFEQFCKNPEITTHPSLVVKIGEKFYNWACAAPILLCLNTFEENLPENCVDNLVKNHMSKRKKGWFWGFGGRDPSSTSQSGVKNNKDNKIKEIPSITKESPEDSKEEINVEPDKFVKSTRLTPEQIAKLGLKEGANEITYTVTTSLQGTTRLVSYIHLFRWDDRLIISDIDGTITKSDVFGQVLPMLPFFRHDWSQAGIAKLYQDIHRNGYKFIYLSARAIGQAHTTRQYLKSIKQIGQHELPDGPLLLSPSSLISAFHKEVIERKPEEFKISCLKDIRDLFHDRNPFYAGYGNRSNDVWAYQAVGVPLSRIFTVNHRGELTLEKTPGFLSSYEKMNSIVDHLFPPLVDGERLPKLNKERHTSGKIESCNFPEAEEFSNFTYWREPIQDVVIDLDAYKKTGVLPE
ncbi:DgyrCDS3963 [Dimorphilus gyrociliatus]|uniref:phosphatidate phosphatase n=1 Tax=Dimorphilus gyrociliatus TaxID=2664684 RepID=A0A7I8VHM9_9ANNE|nr:DgyrCDS3963 [Dimorphilus gyrociliatus]